MSFTAFNGSGILTCTATPTGVAGAAIDANFVLVAEHLVNVANPHSVTAAQVGAYTTQQIDAAFASAVAPLLPMSGGTMTGGLTVIGLTFADASTQSTAYLGVSNLGSVLTAGANAVGTSVNMNTGTGSGGGSINMDGGRVTNCLSLQLVNLDTGGSQARAITCPTNNTINLNANTINMNTGGGYGGGGGTLNMDTGYITNIQAANLQVVDGLNGSGAYTNFTFVNGICTAAS